MSQFKNLDLRAYMMRRGVAQWQLAKHLNVHEVTMCRRFRKEFTEEEKTKMLAAVDAIAEKEV